MVNLISKAAQEGVVANPNTQRKELLQLRTGQIIF